MTAAIELRGFKELLRYVDRSSRAAVKALPIAINDSMRYAGIISSEDIRDQINVGRNYIGDSRNPKSKLRITKYATAANPEAIMASRDNAVSLARFIVGKPTFAKTRRGIKVRVKTGSGGQTVRRAFAVKLRQGSKAIEDGFNIGLAVRLKEGETLDNKRVRAKPFGKNLYLLYGPSVGQVFQTVSDDVQPRVGDRLVLNYLRQFERFSNG